MSPLLGTLQVPGDKSISHRALIFSAFSRGRSRIYNCSPAADVRSTGECLSKLGLEIEADRDAHGSAPVIVIESRGIDELRAPSGELFAGNSGTTMRLLSGLVAGRSFSTRFDGDDSLRRRTMKRIFDPLVEMGASVRARDSAYAPFEINGSALRGRSFQLQVASAQVEACLLLAGLQAEGETSVTAPYTVRDHTSRMFSHIGIPFSADNGTLAVRRLQEPVPPFELVVPGDISSAAFFMVAAACRPGSNLLLQNVGMNPGRTLIVDVLKEMGADLEIVEPREQCCEPIADIRVKYSGPLHGITLGKERVASGIDELPVLALAGALGKGELRVSGAEELRHKESDRIKALCDNLKLAGVAVDELPDGFIIRGGSAVEGGSPWQSHGDHRLAMTGAIASALFEKPVAIDDLDCAAVSYPGFYDDLARLLRS